MRRPKLLSDGSRQKMSYRTDAGPRHASSRRAAPRRGSSRLATAAHDAHPAKKHLPAALWVLFRRFDAGATAARARHGTRRPHRPIKTALNGTTIGT